MYIGDTNHYKSIKMKNLSFISLFLLLISCTQPFSKIEVNDEKSKIIEKIFQEVAAEKTQYLEEIFSDNMKMVNSKKVEFNKNEFLSGIKDMYDLFENISFDLVDANADGSEIETNYYSNGKVWTSVWNNFSATGKYTGKKVSFPFHISYQWEGNKIIEEFQFFDMSIFEDETIARNAQNKNSTKVLGLADLSINKGFSKSDVEEFLVRFTKFIRNTEPNTYDFGYFISSDGASVNLVEKYFTPEDFVYHLNNFENNEISKEFLNVFTIRKVVFAGNVSEELKNKAKNYGAEIRSQIGGWIY